MDEHVNCRHYECPTGASWFVKALVKFEHGTSTQSAWYCHEHVNEHSASMAVQDDVFSITLTHVKD